MFMSVTVANLLARLCFLGALYVSTCCNTRVPSPRGWCAWLGPAQPSYLRAFPPPSLQLLPAAESTAVTPAPISAFLLDLHLREEGGFYQPHLDLDRILNYQ